MLIVRNMEAEDRAAAAELDRLCFHGADCHPDFVREETKRLALYDGGRGVGFVAVEIPESTHLCTMCAPAEPRVVGFATVFFAPEEGQIVNVATHPDFRRQGFGRMAVQTLLAEAAQKGLRRVFLEVRESNAAAQHLYQVMGFSPCGVRKNFYRRPIEHAVLYVAAISV